MLRVPIRNKIRNMPKGEGPGSGPKGRINRLRKLVTATIRHERVEGYWGGLHETQGYVERLIEEAQKNGDKHPQTMELIDFWLLEKDLVHKLFKVLVPRYENYSSSFTQMHRLPTNLPGTPIPMGLLELKENPWPPVVPKERDFKNTLVNVLLSEARKEYREKKYKQIANAMEQDIKSNNQSQSTTQNNEGTSV